MTMGPGPGRLLEASQAPRQRGRIRLRVASLVALAVFCLTIGDIGENRIWVAGVLLILTPVPVILPRLFEAEQWMVAQSTFDVVATVALAGFIPNVWAACLVIVVTSPAAAAAIIARHRYLILELSGLVGLGFVAVVSGASGWIVPFGVALVMVPLVASYVDVAQVHQESARAYLDDIARSTSISFWELDARTGDFLSVGGEIEDVFGYTEAELPRDLPSILAESDRGMLWEKILENEADAFDLECRCVDRSGAERWLRLNVRRMSTKDGHTLRGMAIDITDLIGAHEEARRQADRDHLTGLPNRSVLVRELDRRCAVGEPFALYFLDFDRFKDINDTLGHAGGDHFLATMAHRLTDVAPDDALVARLGGDEFAVLHTANTGVDDISEIAVALSRACQESVHVDGIDLAGSAALGVAIAPIHGDSSRDLLRRADLAMYKAKKLGTAIHVFNFESDQMKAKQLQISGEVEAALESGDLRLWFQPKLELGSRQIVGAEGLLRWQHPVHGPMSPGQFLEVVELSRFRRTLCRHVIRQGAAFAASTCRFGHDLKVAVNITIRDLVDPDLPLIIENSLAEHDLAPSQLILEITERDLMDDRTGFDQAARTVRDTGVELSIDDFGTGQSSLLRLHWLPVTELKIDRSFVNGLGVDSEAEIIVRSIIELGHALGHRVVAEGIETARQLAQLRALRCTHGQGYLFSPAVAPEDFLPMLMPDGDPVFAPKR